MYLYIAGTKQCTSDISATHAFKKSLYLNKKERKKES